ncbi:MAG TPA: mechanosensitive ion channel family protein [Methylophilaceae bacterium]|nr:mechanosensitive ion channel family protein [Methylophilaceae bacterium]
MDQAMIAIWTGINMEDLREVWEMFRASFHILLILIIAYVAFRAMGRLLRAFQVFAMTRADDNPEEIKRISTLSQVFRYLFTVIITVVTVMLILSELGISIAPILATAGVAGVAIGFGAQSLVKDYFTGFILLLENQIRQGDVVEVAGKGGFVEEVTLRFVKLRDYDGNVHFIPNGAISVVTNMSRQFAFSVIDIAVAYKEDVDEVMEIMREVGRALRADPAFKDRILSDIEMAGVDRLGESSVTIRCRFQVTALSQWDVRREFYRLIKRAFDERGIEIPFRHLTVYPGHHKDGNVDPLIAAIPPKPNGGESPRPQPS